MGFYDLSKDERTNLVKKIGRDIENDLSQGGYDHIAAYFSDGDTYIRKAAYLETGKLYKEKPLLRSSILNLFRELITSDLFSVRQTVINAAGEIGMSDFEAVSGYFSAGLNDPHHAVRNAVIGSLKKMGEKNPLPVFTWSQQYLHSPDPEVRRQICHGLELRGRAHPEDILPLLASLQNDDSSRVRDTLVHVIGQISYKKGCLETVISALRLWENQVLVKKALKEIVDVHARYRKFSGLTQQQAIHYIEKNYYHKSRI